MNRMEKYRYEQELSVMDENATPLKEIRSTVYVNTVGVEEKTVLGMLKMYGEHFLSISDRDMISTKSDTDSLNEMFGDRREGGCAL